MIYIGNVHNQLNEYFKKIIYFDLLRTKRVFKKFVYFDIKSKLGNQQDINQPIYTI